jgi:hypothetical protein
MNKPVSPASQVIDDAVRDAWAAQMDNPRAIAAAALRVAAVRTGDLVGDSFRPGFAEGVLAAGSFLERIAFELEPPDEVPPVEVEQEITGNGSRASLPPFSNEPRVGEPLPLWLVMARAEAKESGSHAYQPQNFSSGCIKAWAPVIEALRDYLLVEEGLTPMLPGGYDESRIRWEEHQRLRAMLTEEAAVARQAGPH